jgi:transcription antitermination factor NusG
VVALPLFSGYVFVRINRSERMQVLTAPGVLHLVGRGEPTPIPDAEIERVQHCLQRRAPLEIHEYLPTGSLVLVKAGPLTGLEGLLVRRGNGTRLVLSISVIESSIAVEVDAADVVPVAPLHTGVAHSAA